MRRCTPRCGNNPQSNNSNDNIVMTLLVKDGYIDMNGIVFYERRSYSRNKRQHPVGFKKGTFFLQVTMVGLQKENFALKILGKMAGNSIQKLKRLF